MRARKAFAICLVIGGVLYIVPPFVYPSKAQAATSETVWMDEGTLNKNMPWQSVIYSRYPNAAYGSYPSTYSYNKNGQAGNLQAVEIKLVPLDKIPHPVPIYTTVTGRSTTVTGHIDHGWADWSGYFSWPNTDTVSYYDAPSGQTLTVTLGKSGSPYAISSKWGRQYSYSNGANKNYDKYTHDVLGYMSDSYWWYWGGAYAYDWSKPRTPTDYYGPDPNKTGWHLYYIAWADTNPQPASDYKNLTTWTKYGWRWESDSSQGTPTYNIYRKGVILRYYKDTTLYDYRQNYAKTISLPDYTYISGYNYYYTTDQWEVYVEYTGTVNDTTAISANPNRLYTNQTATVSAWLKGSIDTGHRLLIWNATTHQNVAYGGWGSTSVQAPVTAPNAQTDQYLVYVTDGAGNWVSGGEMATVTWNWPTVYITASPTALQVGQSTTITASVPPGTLNSSQTLVIYDATAKLYYTNTGGWGNTTYTIHVSQDKATTHTYMAYIRSKTNGYLSGDENEVSVSWQALALTEAQVYHTTAWQKNLDAWNREYPSQQRTESDFWAGEEFKFRVKPSTVTDIKSATVTVPELQYYPYVSVGAPSQLIIPLTYNPSTGYLEGHSDPNLETYFQYLQDGTYTAQFTIQTTYNTTATASVPFSILGPWTEYWKQTQVW